MMRGGSYHIVTGFIFLVYATGENSLAPLYPRLKKPDFLLEFPIRYGFFLAVNVFPPQKHYEIKYQLIFKNLMEIIIEV